MAVWKEMQSQDIRIRTTQIILNRPTMAISGRSSEEEMMLGICFMGFTLPRRSLRLITQLSKLKRSPRRLKKLNCRKIMGRVRRRL